MAFNVAIAVWIVIGAVLVATVLQQWKNRRGRIEAPSACGGITPRGERLEKRPGLAAVFLLVGFVPCGLLWWLIAYPPFAGWGDGATVIVPVSAPVVVLPYALFFAAGTIAGFSGTRVWRRRWAQIGHLAPFLSLPGLGRDWWAMLFVIGPSLALLWPAWRSLLQQPQMEPIRASDYLVRARDKST